MNDERSLERAARSFLEPGPTRAPEAAVEAALTRIQTIPQERDWHVPWRLPTMTPLARLAAAAVVVAIAVGGSLLVIGGPGPGTGGPPTATPSPTPVASPTSSPTLTASDVGDTLEAGTYRVDGFAAPFSVTLPAGWQLTELTDNSTGLALSSDGKVNFFLGVMDKVYPDPCDTTAGPVAVGSGVDALVTALSSMVGFSVTDVREATVGGASGKTFTITNGIDGSTDCSDDMLPFGTYDRAGEDVDVAMFPGETDQFWVFEVGDVRVLMAVTERFVEATQEVRDGLRFDAGSAP